MGRWKCEILLDVMRAQTGVGLTCLKDATKCDRLLNFELVLMDYEHRTRNGS